MTFYTVSKVSLCGQKDTRIGFSKLWTLINFLISSTALAGITYWVHTLLLDERERDYSWIYPKFFVFGFLYIGTPLYILSAVLTATLLWIDNLCSCCCECWLGVAEVVIYDPSNPEANLVWREGQVH